VGETISLNIGTPESPTSAKIGAQCYDKKMMKFVELLGEFQDFFAWSYKDLHGFYPSLTSHAIPIKEGIKTGKKKQIPVNPALEATIRRELENFLKVGITFPGKCPEWVSKLVHVLKVIDHIIFCINYHTFNQAIMKKSFPSH
jgi:hypothetical protein